MLCYKPAKIKRVINFMFVRCTVKENVFFMCKTVMLFH